MQNLTIQTLSTSFKKAGKAALLFSLLAAVSTQALAEKINLNKADAETIEYIPGVGPSKAKQIVNLRENNGKFTSMDQIDAMPGFGERTMVDVKKYGSLKSGVSKLSKKMKANRPSRSASSAKRKIKNTNKS